jgi:hypothetical protein
MCGADDWRDGANFGPEERCAFDSPFFGAKLFIPVAVACVLACLLIGIIQPAWYWAIPIDLLSLVVVFGAVIWRDSRMEATGAKQDATHSPSDPGGRRHVNGD